MDELRLCHIYLGVDDSSEIIHAAKQGKTPELRKF